MMISAVVKPLGLHRPACRPEQVRLIAELAAQTRMSFAPRFEAERDGLKQMSSWRSGFLSRRTAVEAGAEHGVPADVMA